MLDKLMFVVQIIIGMVFIYFGIADRVKKDDRKIFKNPRLIYIIGGFLVMLLSISWLH
jgi:hypothetical protein